MELKPITHFFNKKIYSVPAYQRGYSWHDKQILDLLSDIDHAIKLDSQHYTGTITIHPQQTTEKVGLNNYEIYHVVDGQQRMTTIILILSYLIKELKKNKNLVKDAVEKEQTYILNKGSYLFRYEIDKVSENYFRSLILEKENLSSLDENLYTRNLNGAKKCIKTFFEKDENKNRLIEFLNALEEKLLFNEYVVADTTEIGIVFETMNNRGIELSNLEIVKNRLLYLTSKISLGEEKESAIKNLSESINSKWAIILKNLTLPDRVLDENTFLNNHWIIYHGWSKDNQTRTQILDEEFSIGKMVEDKETMISNIEKYIKSLATTSLYWRFINYPLEDKAFMEVEDEGIKNDLQYHFNQLNRLSNSTVRPLLLAFMPLMKTNPTKLLELAKTSEIFSFRLFSMNKRRSDTGKNDIFRNSNEFHKNNSKDKTQQDALYYLAWYIDNYGDKERFQVEIDELFKSNKKHGFYSWNGLTYFFFEYEEFKKGNEDGKVEYGFAKTRKKSIEHILPQTTENTEWAKTVKALGDNKLKRHLHSLGNLLLISAQKNSSLRNSKFSIKQESYLKGTFSENEIALNNKTWSLPKIMNREEYLLNFLYDRWGLNEIYLTKYPDPDNLDNEKVEDIEEELNEIEENIMKLFKVEC
ncbi:MAG: hypothetical protein COA97_00750 [Flavobacteriales bacterium]|nr:MAG: hypothetical protein COA97_00750 [Flavobacteriales bacterium]